LAGNTLFTATITTGAQDLAGNPLTNNFVWTFTTGATPDTTAPTVNSTTPANGATGFPVNSNLLATFSEPMSPQTITNQTFTVTGPGTTPVAGTVTYVGNTATFNPNAQLPGNTLFTATITTGAQDLAGNPLANNFVWTFTTGATPDTTAPTVTSTSPINGTTGVAVTENVLADFSEAMNPLTITNQTFTVTGPGGVAVPGAVTYAGTTATFNPNSDFTEGALFTATITTGARDLAGNPLANNFVWTFTTASPPIIEPVVELGDIAPFGSFGGGAGMTNQGILTVVEGDIGTTGAPTLITGFHDSTGRTYTETPSNMGLVTGTIYTNETAESLAIVTQASADARDAFAELAGMPGGVDAGAGHLGGLTLAPGVYKSASGTFDIIGSDLVLDAQNDPNAFWVFQMATSLTVGAPAAPRSVRIINGFEGQEANVYWQVGSAATINGAGGGTMIGTIIASAGVTFSTAGNVEITRLIGRAIGLDASVTMVNTVITLP
jgi:ketosteroid isomerase-like protein